MSKGDFIMNLKNKSALLSAMHKEPLMVIGDGKKKVAGALNTAFVPMWREIIPARAMVPSDVLNWADILEIVKHRCEVYYDLMHGKNAASMNSQSQKMYGTSQGSG